MLSVELSKKLSYYLRIELENKVKKLQTELGDNTFDRVDFNKYSFEELEKLELELTYRKRAEDVKNGKRYWWEAIAVHGKLKGRTLNKDFYRGSDKENANLLSNELTEYYLKKLTGLTSKEIEENKKHNQKIVKSIVLRIDDYISKKTNVLLHSSPQVNFVEEVSIVNGMVIIDMTFSMKFGELNIKKFKRDIEINVLKHSIYSVVKDSNEKVRVCILLDSLDGIREDGVFPFELAVFAEFVNSLKENNKLDFVLGIDNNGAVLTRDLRHYGALGIFGGAGSGKTNFVKQMLSSLMLYKSPEEVKFVVIGGYESEYAFISPLYLHKIVSDNLDLETKKKDEIIEVLKEVNSEIERRKQTSDKAGKNNELVICLDELRAPLLVENDEWYDELETPLLTENDKWYQEVCSLIKNIILEGPDVGVYSVGIGFGLTNRSKPLYLKEITNVTWFNLPIYDAAWLRSFDIDPWKLDRGAALCDILIKEEPLPSVVNPGKEVMVKTLKMDDKMLEAINSKLSL